MEIAKPLQEKPRILLVVVSHSSTKYTMEPIYQNKSALEWVIEGVSQMFPDATLIHTIPPDLQELTHDTISPTVKNVQTASTIYDMLQGISKEASSADAIVWIHSTAPLFLPSLVKQALDQHLEEMAEYTYFENFPQGMGCEVISPFAYKKIAQIASGNNEPYSSTSIHRLFYFDINAYDVEIILSPEDRRKDRLRLICDTYRNTQIVKSLLEHIHQKPQDITTEMVYRTLDTFPEILRPFPNYIEIQLTAGIELQHAYAPKYRLSEATTKDSSLNVLKNPLKDILPMEAIVPLITALSSWCKEGYVCFTEFGEPTLHPNMAEILNHCLTETVFKIILETNGYSMPGSLIDFILQHPLKDRLDIIISLDAAQSDTYQQIHGVDQFQQAEANALRLIKHHRKHTYLQFVYLKANEQQLAGFQSRWKDYEDQIIYQKVNACRSLNPGQSPLDLSPIKRFPCWHLQRDLFIATNADVLICKQDCEHQHVMGNILDPAHGVQEELERAWKKAHDWYRWHYQRFGGSYPKNNPLNPDPTADSVKESFCSSCDEWYTFTF